MVESKQVERVDKIVFVPPKKMFLKLVSNRTRLKISFGSEVEGCYMVYVNLLDDLRSGKVQELFAAFVSDSEDWKVKRDNR